MKRGYRWNDQRSSPGAGWRPKCGAQAMGLTYQCSKCHSVNHVSLQVAGDRVLCRVCASEQPLHREHVDDGHVSACPLCATTDLYVQKDFPQGLGLFIVIVGFVISTVFWYLEKPLFTYLILL